MFRSSFRRGITLVEVLVVVFVIFLLLCLLVPYLSNSRTPSRRAACINNLKQIGLALHNHHDAHGTFPASNDVRLLPTPGGSWRDVPLHTPAEPAPSVGPAEYGTNYSWLTKILPYCEENNIYKWLDTENLRAWDTSNPVDMSTMLPANQTLPSHMMAW
ncbi:MAG: DUF1559 domain-containing protein, partial [Pirellulaceae bacterium]|nr:DUF1559 domain-containing protein [Pirellulaceae bacterium]